MMRAERSRQLTEEAGSLMPGGVSSPVRAFGAVGGHPLYIACGRGATLTDVDGNHYIDYVCSWGPLILGHAHPDVIRAVEQAARLGTSYGAPHAGEIALARAISARMPWVEMVRFVNSGTEATMSALRLARAATGRTRIVKFEGNYHGHVDALLVKAGSGVATLGLPDSAGVPEAVAGDTLVARYNHLEDVRALFQAHGDSIAALLVEPVAGNMGVVPPREGFLEGLREVTVRAGSLLIFDEVITGFRLAPGGAAQRYAVEPDLVCLGKIIGGGLPVGAYGGRRDLMEQMAPLGPVYQAGTLSGNPLAMAAGLVTLEKLTSDSYALLEKRGAALEKGLSSALSGRGVSARINRVGSMLSLFFAQDPVDDSTSALSTDRDRYRTLFHALLRRGIYAPPSALETWFLSTAHSEERLEQTVHAFASALEEVRS